MRRFWIGCIIWVCVGFLGIERSPDGTGTTIRVGARAHGLFVGRMLSRAKRWARRAVRNTGRWARRAVRNTGRWARRAVRNTGRWAHRAVRNTVRWARRAVRNTGRWAHRAWRSTGRWAHRAWRNSGRWALRAARNASRWASRAARNAGRWAIRAARTASRLAGKALKTAGRLASSAVGGLAHAGAALGKSALAAGKLVGRVAEAGVGVVGGGLAALGSVAKGDFRTAWSTMQETTKKAGKNLVKAGGDWLKANAAAAGEATDGLMNWVSGGVWDQVKDEIKEKLEKAVKAVLGSQLFKWVASNVTKVVERAASLLGEKRVADAIQIVHQVMGAIDKLQELVHAIRNPNEYIQRGREWAVDRLADLAMKVLDGPIRKVAGVLMGAALSVMKHIVSVPLTALVTGAAAAASLGLGAATAPAIWFLINKLLDWAIGQVEGALAKLAMGSAAVRNFLKKSILRPLVNGAYDKIVGLLHKKVGAL